MNVAISRDDTKNFITVAECVYLLYFTVLYGARAVGLYEGLLPYNICLVVGMLLFALKVATTEHTLIEYLLIGGLMLLSLVVYINTGEKGMMIYFTMMLGMKGVSVKRVFKMGAMIQIPAYIILVLLSLTGVINENFYVQSRIGVGEVFRHSLGYPHPNTLHSTYIVMTVLIMYLVGKQSKKKLATISFGLFVGSLYIYLYSGSNTGLMVSAGYLMANFYFQTRKRLCLVEKGVINLVYPACIVFSTIGPLVIKGKLFDIINKLLNTRWALALYYFENEPITLLGTRFKEPPSTHYMIDSSFLYSFLQLGIVAFLIITIFNMITINEMVKRDRRTEIAIMVSFCIMGISDPFLFNLSYKNLMFLFVGNVLYQKLNGMKVRVPDILRKKIIIFKAGNRPVECRGENIISEMQVTLKTVVVFVLLAIVISSMYFVTKPETEVIYVNDKVWKKSSEFQKIDKNRWEEYAVYLNENDVEEVKAQGGIIRGYTSSQEPMYPYTDSIARMEHLRNGMSVGVWGSFFIIALWSIIKKRKSITW